MMKFRNHYFLILILFIFIFSFGWLIGNSNFQEYKEVTAQDMVFDEEAATIQAIKKVMPAVVSILVYDEVNTIKIDIDSGEQSNEVEKMQSGNGTGFLISSDGLILTNKHVVEAAKEKTGEYKIIMNTKKEYYAQLIGKDPINDLAVLKIFDKDLPFVEIGNSGELAVGSSVIAIGNSLGRYQNSATKGIISALERYLVTFDGGVKSRLGNVIQTDAEINLGNSGGPLINLQGQVVGVNVAIDEAGQSIGFAIPINDAEPVIRTVKTIGRIVRPMLGVRYAMLTPEIATKYDLPRSSGAWLGIDSDENLEIVLPDTPASRAGLLTGDIIFEINAIPLDKENSLLAVVQRYKPRDKIGLKIQRGNKIIIKIVELDEFK